MNTRSNNQLNMVRTVVKVLLARQNDWSAIPAFSPVLEELQSKLAQLQTSSVEQQSITVGVRASKEQQRLTATDKAETISNALRVLAATNGDAALSAQFSFTRSDLLRANTAKVIQLFTTVRDAAQSHAEALQDYGITEEQIQELSAICETLPAMLGSTRSAIVERRERTETHAELLSQTIDLLQHRMDKLAELIRAEHPETYKQYQAARTVVDLKGKSIKPKGAGNNDGGLDLSSPPAGNIPDHPLP